MRTKDEFKATATDLEAKVLALLESGEWVEAFKAASKFHKYSIANIFLIYSQMPEARRVAGFKTWLALNRYVKKGERALRVWSHPIMVEDKRHEGKLFPYYKLVPVFDISQTEGEDLPEPPMPVEILGEQDFTRRSIAKTQQFITDCGLSWYYETQPVPEWGHYNPSKQHIMVRHGLSPNMELHTWLHELAHYLEDHTTDQDRGDMETVAEGAAYLACARLGMDTDAFAVPYIAGWASSMTVFRRNMGRLNKLADKLVSVADVTIEEA